MATTYSCKDCGKPAKVENGKVKRSCGCKGAVVAQLKATAKGAGAMS